MRFSLVLVGLSIAACGHAPSQELLDRGQSVLDEDRRLAEAFPDPDTLTESECPVGLSVQLVSWTNLSEGMPRDGWINQTGLEAFERGPRVSGLARYTNNPEEWKTRELEEGVLAREAVSHVRVARITEVSPGHRTGDDTFTPGRITAWVVTLNRDDQEVVCAQRAQVENADWVSADAIERQVENFVRGAVGPLQ